MTTRWVGGVKMWNSMEQLSPGATTGESKHCNEKILHAATKTQDSNFFFLKDVVQLKPIPIGGWPTSGRIINAAEILPKKWGVWAPHQDPTRHKH